MYIYHIFFIRSSVSEYLGCFYVLVIVSSAALNIANKGPSSQSYGFSSNHVQMWELDYKESWEPKNWCFELWCWRRLLRVLWTARRSHQSILKEINPGIFLEEMILKLKLQYFCHLMWRVDSLEKTDAGRDWRQEEKGTTEDEMAGWHYWLNGSESEWTPGVGYGQGGLTCCDSWGCRVGHDWATGLNWTELNTRTEGRSLIWKGANLWC